MRLSQMLDIKSKNSVNVPAHNGRNSRQLELPETDRAIRGLFVSNSCDTRALGPTINV